MLNRGLKFGTILNREHLTIHMESLLYKDSYRGVTPLSAVEWWFVYRGHVIFFAREG